MANLPLELHLDKHNLWYMDFDFTQGQLINIDNRDNNTEKYFHNGFYIIPSTNDYIIKLSYTVFTRNQIKRIKNMLTMLMEKQKNVLKTDFPIGYCNCENKFSGLIIKYYADTVSLSELMDTKDLNQVMRYYMKDDDKIHNLFLLFYDILNNLEEMINADVYYTDINRTNVLFENNNPKIIDFDFRYMAFDLKGWLKDKKIEQIIFNYLLTVSEALKDFNLYDLTDIRMAKPDYAKKYLKELEYKIRRG